MYCDKFGSNYNRETYHYIIHKIELIEIIGESHWLHISLKKLSLIFINITWQLKRRYKLLQYILFFKLKLIQTTLNISDSFWLCFVDVVLFIYILFFCCDGCFFQKKEFW